MVGPLIAGALYALGGAWPLALGAALMLVPVLATRTGLRRPAPV